MPITILEGVKKKNKKTTPLYNVNYTTHPPPINQASIEFYRSLFLSFNIRVNYFNMKQS